ncbi:hypothetical protein C8R46DRAFT_1035422 [Mycena filopes]|nr:hypothetical protein C8R46DRAFT_1035422 [Mycena filopes]
MSQQVPTHRRPLQRSGPQEDGQTVAKYDTLEDHERERSKSDGAHSHISCVCLNLVYRNISARRDGRVKRSPTLASQVAWLNANPKVDYALTAVPVPLPITDLDFPDPEAHTLFRKCRDKQSVALMLKQEYEFEELGRAVAEMQQRQNRDPFRRPPLLAEMAPQNWVRFCQGMDVNRQVILE